MRRRLGLTEIPESRPYPGRACALALHRPTPAHLLSQIFPLARGRPPPAGCTHAPRADAAAARGRGRPPERQGACGLRRRPRVRRGSHGAHVSAEGRWDLRTVPGCARWPECGRIAVIHKPFVVIKWSFIFESRLARPGHTFPSIRRV